MVIRATIASADPLANAQIFQAILAVDKGYTSTLTQKGSTVTVVASDGQAVVFTKGAKS